MTTTDYIFKSTRDRAIAEIVGYRNYLRISDMLAELSAISADYDSAIEILDESMDIIQEQFIDTNRGGKCGLHGFIAEVAECGTVNADEVAHGNDVVYTWINDNGPMDMMRDGTPIQSKFCSGADGMSLTAVQKHLEKYPWFISSGGKYIIPKDQYEKIQYLLSIPEDAANKMGTQTGDFSLRDWKFVHEFFETSGISMENIEPSRLDYAEVQQGNISDTIEKSKEEVGDICDERRADSVQDHQPTVREGLISAGIGAGVQAGSTFVLEIYKLMRNGKRIKEFSDSDWMNIIRKSGTGAVSGGLKAGAIYAMTNLAGISSNSAGGVSSIAEGIAKQVGLYLTGRIDSVELVENAEILCLDTCVSVLATWAGQMVIPIPILGGLISNMVITIAYGSLKRYLLRKEESVLAGYCVEIDELNDRLEKEYKQAIGDMVSDYIWLLELVEQVNASENVEAFNASAKIVSNLESKDALTCVSQVDSYFLL